MKTTGVTARGIRAPIIRAGDDLIRIITDSLNQAMIHESFALRDRDVLGVTESIVARAQNNYATIEQIAEHVKTLTGGGHLGIVFPILSRNRFSPLLKGISMAADKLTILLNFPADEVGNHIVSVDEMDAKGVNPYKDTLTEKRFREIFGENTVHPYTGIDYVKHYREESLCEVEYAFSNDPREILKYTDTVIAADIHTRARTRRVLEASGAKLVITLDQILNEPVRGSGYNSRYGLLGSNKATESSVKLFPENGQALVEDLQKALREMTGANVEVLIFGDGAYKDPVGNIWELADPVVSPAFTSGLRGTPNELKMKYLADNEFSHLSVEQAREAIIKSIREKDESLVGSMRAEGTTPRHLTDLLGSLCDLMGGSGDKGTPIILVQGYFDNYAT